MKKALSIAFLPILVLATEGHGSDFGITGLIDIPTARMLDDGVLKSSAAIQSRSNSYSLTYQITPWLESTFRYTGFNDFDVWDRNYETKLKLVNETSVLPQIAVGVRDLVGTGVWGSEYLVASKKYQDFDFTVGIGWGRLSGTGNLKNPFLYLSDKFSERKTNDSQGGKLAYSSFFSGGQVGIFGGLSYSIPTFPLHLMVEYNPDEYAFETSLGSAKLQSKINKAIKWDIFSNTSLTLSHQNSQDWGIVLNTQLNTTKIIQKPKPKFFPSSIDLNQKQLPKGFDVASWYDLLLFDAERAGLLLFEASLDQKNHSATIVMGNASFSLWADAVSKMSKLADLHLPSSINNFHFVIQEYGHKVNTISMRRPSFDYLKNGLIREYNIRINPAKSSSRPQHRTDFLTKKLYFDLSVASKFQFFDPDDPARYQIYGNVGISTVLPRSWTLKGSYHINLNSNFDEITRTSDSKLPRVRSDVAKYLQNGETGLDSLYIERRGSVTGGCGHYRVFFGILETMYSGFGGEFLCQHLESRIAYGLSANIVKKRDFDKSFNHLNYQTNTAFASIYWALPLYNLDLALHAGKYLAKDYGSTFEVRRTFENGWMIGAWATFTDVSSEDFGEGSFDKGLFFKIPLDGLTQGNTRSSFKTRLRPIQRDGGQRLDDFSGNLWWDLRQVRYDAFSKRKKRLL